MKKYLKLALTILALMGIFLGVLLITKAVSTNPALIELIARFGYLGVVFTAILAGLNTFVPLPAATFTPLFIASGLVVPLIILSLAIGTLIADYIGYVFGHVSREMIKEKYSKTFEFIQKFQEKHQKLIWPLVFLYASFVPFPNEVVLIPLALSGIRFRKIFIPLILGNFMHQAILIYGVTNIFTILP
jgi:membrane protein YqaA with SNARE-associated domain